MIEDERIFICMEPVNVLWCIMGIVMDLLSAEVVMLRLRFLGLMCFLILLLVGVSHTVNKSTSVFARELSLETLTDETPSTSSSLLTQQPEACPLTKPQEPAFIPPPPYQQESISAGSFWYGTEALWVSLRHNGTWAELPYRNEGYVQKILWWSEGFDPYAEPSPEFTTTLRRLDQPGPSLVQTGASHGWHPQLVSFIVGGAHIPSTGCWEVTGQYKDAVLSFVVWVDP
jgi:hypothetical protein